MYRRDSIWIYASGFVLLLVSGFLFWSFFQPEWKEHQTDFRDLASQKFGPGKAAQVPSGMQQIWVKDVGVVDRCVTCHQGMEWRGLDTVPNPHKAHPREILKKHPLAAYGCTPCHGGQGYATDAEPAHGPIDYWEEPLMGKQLSELYLVRTRNAMLQMRCNSCHRFERETKGADFLNRA